MNLVLEKWSYFFEEIQTCSVFSAVSQSKKKKKERIDAEAQKKIRIQINHS